MRDKRSVVKDVACMNDSITSAPLIDPVHTQQFFGDLKGFAAVDELIMIATGGVPVHAAATGVDLTRAFQYGNHPSANEPLPAVWLTLSEDVQQQKSFVILNSGVQEVPKLRVSPLATVVTHKVRIIKDLPFHDQSRESKGGLNGDTNLHTAP